MIDIKALSFSYGKKKIFDTLDFSSGNNTCIIIKGPSGCGKTTLLKLLTNNLKAESVSNLPNKTKKSLVLQEDALYPWMTGTDNILKVINVTKKDIVDHPLYQKLAPFIDQYAYQMSYGQRRMVELFRVILYRPDFLCLDEPFNFLDPTNRKMMLDYILKEVAPTAIIVMSTHYNEDTSGLNLPTLYFDGQFPVRKLLTENEFKKL